MKSCFLCLTCLTAATGAHAALVYSGNVGIPIPTNFSGVSIDLLNVTSFNGDPAPDWSDSQVNFFLGGAVILSGPRLLPVRIGTEATDMVIRLSAGDLVHSGSIVAAVGPGGSQTHIGIGPGRFESGVEGFLGFRIDLTGSGDFANGYMRVTLTDGTSPGTIHEWAYSDTPGEAVTVGAVPESTTVFLVGLGTSLLLVRSRRPAG